MNDDASGRVAPYLSLLCRPHLYRWCQCCGEELVLQCLFDGNLPSACFAIHFLSIVFFGQCAWLCILLVACGLCVGCLLVPVRSLGAKLLFLSLDSMLAPALDPGLDDMCVHLHWQKIIKKKNASRRLAWQQTGNSIFV